MIDWHTSEIVICNKCRGEGQVVVCSGGRYHNRDYDPKYSVCPDCEGDRVLLQRTHKTTERIAKDTP